MHHTRRNQGTHSGRASRQLHTHPPHPTLALLGKDSGVKTCKGVWYPLGGDATIPLGEDVSGGGTVWRLVVGLISAGTLVPFSPPQAALQESTLGPRPLLSL